MRDEKNRILKCNGYNLRCLGDMQPGFQPATQIRPFCPAVACFLVDGALLIHPTVLFNGRLLRHAISTQAL